MIRKSRQKPTKKREEVTRTGGFTAAAHLALTAASYRNFRSDERHSGDERHSDTVRSTWYPPLQQLSTQVYSTCPPKTILQQTSQNSIWNSHHLSLPNKINHFSTTSSKNSSLPSLQRILFTWGLRYSGPKSKSWSECHLPYAFPHPLLSVL